MISKTNSQVDTSIIIVNWNGERLIKECLESLLKQTYKKYEIILVDNGSVDKSVTYFKKYFPRSKTILNKKNQGFAAANNQGIELAMRNPRIKYFVCLNNDTTQDKEWLKMIVGYMKKYPKVGAAQGLVLNFENRSEIDSTGVYLDLGFFPHQRGFEKSNKDLEKKIIGPSATSSIYTREALEAIYERSGYFDKSFFAYVEDVDLALRIKTRGYDNTYIDNAIVYHHGSATGKKLPYKKMYWGARNLVLLLVKNVPLKIQWKQKSPIFKSHLANLRALSKTDKRLLLSYCLGVIAGLLKSPLYLKKRYVNLKYNNLTTEDWDAILIPLKHLVGKHEDTSEIIE